MKEFTLNQEDGYTHGRLLPRSGLNEQEVQEFEKIPFNQEVGGKIINPETLEIVMQRVPVKEVLHIIPERFLMNLEQNQKISTCCRHPENHYIEGWKSHPREPAPDIYIFYCDCCNRKHHIFCLGETDLRPIWNRTLKY